MCAPESFSEYLAYEILHRPDSWQGFLYIYIYIFFIFHFPDSRLSVLKGFLFLFLMAWQWKPPIVSCLKWSTYFNILIHSAGIWKVTIQPRLKNGTHLSCWESAPKEWVYVSLPHVRCSVTQWSPTRLCAGLYVCSKVPWVPPTPPVTLTQINGRIFEKVR